MSKKVVSGYSMISRLAVAAATLALAFGAPVDKPAGFASLPLRREVVRTNVSSTTLDLHRRSEGATLGFNAIRYFADFSLGGQLQTNAVMDTGSSNTWTSYGNYDPSKSSSYHYINSNFYENYGYGDDAVTGEWGTDTLNFGSVTLPSFPFGVLNSGVRSGVGTAILGMGPKAAESPSEAQFPTLPQQLQSDGVISANAFSLFISEEDQSEATLIFGGVDQAKYSGPLYTIPLDTTEAYGTQYFAVNFEFEGEEYTGGILDSGTPAVLLPQSVADPIAEKYGAIWLPEWDAYAAESKVENPPDQEFKIGGISVTIPGDEFYIGNGDEGPYQLGIGRSIVYQGNTDLNILGEPFMRQLYLVYDVDNEQIGFAPVKYSSESSIVAIESSIPGGTPAPNQAVGGPSYQG